MYLVFLACIHTQPRTNHYLFMKLMLALPLLSRLDLIIGKEDEMFTVNMVPVVIRQGYGSMLSRGSAMGECYPKTLYLSKLEVKCCMCICVQKV